MKKYFNGPALLSALLALALFVAAAGAARYWDTGVFMGAQEALVYVILGAAGALALLLRRVLLAFLFYVGCGLGWLAGRYIGSLNGDFAPTAGLIATFFLIALFTLLGLSLEWSLFRRRRKKAKSRRERQQQEDEERERKLIQEQEAKAASAASGGQGESVQPPMDEPQSPGSL